MDDTVEVLTDLNSKVEAAKQMGERIVETTPEIIAFFNPKGLGSIDGKPIYHFDYKGVSVCAYGDRDKVEASLNRDTNTIAHGVQEGLRVNG